MGGAGALRRAVEDHRGVAVEEHIGAGRGAGGALAGTGGSEGGGPVRQQRGGGGGGEVIREKSFTLPNHPGKVGLADAESASLEMKIRVFVTSSASVLLLWLGVTYVREVPYQHYPRLGKDSQPISAEAKTAEASESLLSLEQDEQSPSLAGAE